jgi:hypothetical protein
MLFVDDKGVIIKNSVQDYSRLKNVPLDGKIMHFFGMTEKIYLKECPEAEKILHKLKLIDE